MDTVPPEIRSRIMGAVRQKNTGPELIIRQALHKLGLRYRVNVSKMPGRPDIVFPKFNAAVFVHGCYWHRHGCYRSTTPKSNTEHWLRKFIANRQRDARKSKSLRDSGWRVLTVWECEFVGKFARAPEAVANDVKAWLEGEDTTGEIPERLGVRGKFL
ncbi:very short patch repair endonuclease [Rhodovulum sp. YNF3179]